METGDKVKLAQPVIKGKVMDTRYNKDGKCLEHLVAYTDADGQVHERWFLESQLEAA